MTEGIIYASRNANTLYLMCPLGIRKIAHLQGVALAHAGTDMQEQRG